jgi:hypothetical protein
MTDETPHPEPIRPLRLARDERHDVEQPIREAATPARWRRLAHELWEAAAELSQSRGERPDLRQRIGRLCCVEALSQGVSETVSGPGAGQISR